MGVGTLFFNEKGELLIVKPTYKDDWSIPGGVIEQNESPLQTCRREVKEEIGLDVMNIDQMLCVDYIFPTKQQDENIQFIFYGGVLNLEQISNIKLAANELKEYKFIEIQKAKKLFGFKLNKRISHCITAIKNKSCKYLENGNLIKSYS